MIRALLCAAALLLAGAPSYAGPNVDAEAQNFSICSGVNASLAAGTCTGGLLSSGLVTNPSTNQVVLGPFDTAGAGSWDFWQINASGSGAVYVMQESDDQVNWVSASGQTAETGTSAFAGNFPTAGGVFDGPIHHRYMRVMASAGATEVSTIFGYLRAAAFTPMIATPYSYFRSQTAAVYVGGGNVAITPTTNSAGDVIVMPYAMREMTWNYSTNGTPITTATSVTLHAAVGGQVNSLDTLYCDNSAATASEIQVLDGASVIWDRYVPASASNFAVKAPGGIPVYGSVNSTMSLKVVTAGTSLYCSAAGYMSF